MAGADSPEPIEEGMENYCTIELQLDRKGETFSLSTLYLFISLFYRLPNYELALATLRFISSSMVAESDISLPR